MTRNSTADHTVVSTKGPARVTEAVQSWNSADSVSLPEKPTLLMVSPQFLWPRDSGQKIATSSDLVSLSKAFRIDVVCFLDPINASSREEGIAALAQLLPGVSFVPVLHSVMGRNFWNKVGTFIRAALSLEPFLVAKFRSRRLLDASLRLYRQHQHDVVYVENPQTAWVLESLPAHERPLIVYRAHDALSETSATYARALVPGPTALAAAVDAFITRRYERRLWSKTDIVLPMTKRLAETIVRDVPGIADKTHYFPVIADTPTVLHARRRTRRVLYIGSAHYPPNLHGLKWFLNECWPLIHKAHPDVTFEVIGRGSEALHPAPRSVELRGYVPDLSTAYENGEVFVVPLFSGSGVRIKILDAITRRLPVVSTSVGYAGLELEPDKHLLVADEAESFARQVCDLLDHPGKADRIAADALDVVMRDHGREAADAVAKRLAELAISRKRGQGG